MDMDFDQFVVGCTAVLSFTAMILNLTAAMRGPYALRAMNGVRAVLAAMYVVAYVWLFFNSDRRLEWSRTIVGLSLFTWLAVWNFPPLVTLRIERESKRLNKAQATTED